MKSICIKTNNQDWIQYLQNKLKPYSNVNICFSIKNFKHFTNLIIHYTGKENDFFITQISSILAIFVLNELEESFIQNILSNNYFYFSHEEQCEIIKSYYDTLIENHSSNLKLKFNCLYNYFNNFLKNNKYLYLSGFINFRLQDYYKLLDKLLNDSVNTYILEKEYLEFISLLKTYINSQISNCEIVHLIYSSSLSLLLDKRKRIISKSSFLLNAKYLSDISFSPNDYTLNSLLTLLPQKIYVHLIDNQKDEFIKTLQLIFENKITICTHCNTCKLYKMLSKDIK